VGTDLACPLCDRAELPDDLEVVRTTGTWDERTMPPGLRQAHRVAPGTWARLQVVEGELRFRAETEPVIDIMVDGRSPQAIPPDVEHEIDVSGSVRFFLEFLRPEEG